ncbi:uncharacterized protein LOC142210143 [Leptodactylus fuscus]|uniref:uncharacterized protein LOC142210143 n=1 Tax=Leptodactylus fuscus TaxID=238119 RepID=UPI003F4F17D5
MSNSQGRIWASMTCCNTDYCTPTIPTVPVVSAIPNGVICPSCISDGYSGCSSPDTVICTGNENTCIVEKTKITGSYSASFSAQGCATKSFCSLGTLLISASGSRAEFSITCSQVKALSCIQCMSYTSSSCTGDSITCPLGSPCGSIRTQVLIGGVLTPVFFRSCLSSDYCGFMGSITNSQGRIWASMSCCYTDNCTPAIPPVPAASSIPNGVVCPSCTSADFSGCTSSDTVPCTGNEDTCVLERVKITVRAQAASCMWLEMIEMVQSKQNSSGIFQKSCVTIHEPQVDSGAYGPDITRELSLGFHLLSL